MIIFPLEPRSILESPCQFFGLFSRPSLDKGPGLAHPGMVVHFCNCETDIVLFFPGEGTWFWRQNGLSKVSYSRL